eukprot:g5191.t1
MNFVSEAPNEGDVENYGSMFPPTDRMGFLFAQVCQWERQRKWLHYLSAEDIAALGMDVDEYLKKFAACIAANDRSLLRLLDLDGLFERPQKEAASQPQRDLQQAEVVEPAQLRADAERSLLRLGNRERGGVRGHVLIQVLSALWAQESQSSLQPLLDVFHSYLSCRVLSDLHQEDTTPIRHAAGRAKQVKLKPGGVLVLDGCWLGRLLKSCIDQEVHQDFAEITALVDDPLEDAVTRKMLRAPPKPGEPDKYEEEKKEDVGFYDFFPYVDHPLNRTSRHEHMRSVSVPYREEEIAERPARFPKGGSCTLLDTAGWAKQQQQQQQQAAHFSDFRPPTTVYVTSFGFCTDDASRALQKETRCLTSQMLCKFREVKRNISIEYWIHVGPIHNRWVHQDRWTNGSEPFRIEQDETTTKDGDEQDQIQQQEEVTLNNEKENHEARASRSNRGNPTAKKLKANANWGLSIDELRSLVANDFTILEDTVFPTTMFENPSPGTLLKDERLAWCFVAKRKPMKTNSLEAF